jgi:hypothetical protein
MKVFGVICGLAFLGYFLYYNLYFKTDSLIKYVPKESVGYVTFRITPELLQNQRVSQVLNQVAGQYNLKQFNVNDLNQLVGNNLSLALVPQLNNPSGFDTLILLDLGIRTEDIKVYQTWAEQNHWLSQTFANQTKSKNILAIATSQSLLAQVQQVAVKQQPALSQKIDLVFNLKKYQPDKFFGKIFLDKGFFKILSDSFNQPQYKVLLALASENSQIFAGIRADQNGIYVQSDPNSQNTESAGAGQDLPENFIYALSFSDFAAGWQKITENLKQTDSTSYDQLLKNKEYFEGLYNFSVDNDLLPLLAGQVEVFSATGNEYLLTTTLKSGDVETQTNQIETIIKRYIANSYPVVKSRELPDHTYITSIVRDIESLEFNEDEIMGFKIRGILKGDKEYIYILANNHLILANSRDIITDLLNTDQKINNWKNTGLMEILTNYSEKASINLANISQNIKLLSSFANITWFEDKSTGNFMLILK